MSNTTNFTHALCSHKSIVNKIAMLLLIACLSACTKYEYHQTNIVKLDQVSDQASLQVDENALLDVGIVLFDDGVNELDDESAAYANVRKSEAVWFTSQLKNTLEKSNAWGVVRTQPTSNAIVDVLVSGEIVESNGEVISLLISVSDGTGKKWFDKKEYEQRASQYAYNPEVKLPGDPFQALFNQIANDIYDYQATLNVQQRVNIRNITKIRFAQDFVPQAFDDFLVENEQGERVLQRIPAASDPMIQRVERIQARNDLYLDVVQDYYRAFNRNMEGPYNEWRRTGYKEVVYERQLREQARKERIAGVVTILAGVAVAAEGDGRTTRSAGQIGILTGAQIFRRSYGKLEEANIHSEALREMGASLETQLEPSIIDLQDRSVTLSGTVEDQYKEWRRILSRMFALDEGLSETISDMTEKNTGFNKIEAEQFDAPGNPLPSDGLSTQAQRHAADTQPARAWWQSQFNLMLCVFALLAAAALLFVVLAPAPTVGTVNKSVVSEEGTTTQEVQVEEETPWDESRRAQARTDSQDILSELLQSKKRLETLDVQEWGLEQYQAALSLADQGDDFYKQQDYQNAIENYQTALQRMNELNDRIPELLNEKIEQGLSAIEQGKSLLAKQLFNEALILDKNSINALGGLARANTLDEVLELFAQGSQFEQSFASDDKLESLQLANEKYQQVLAVDSDYQKATQSIERVAKLSDDKRYRQFMSQGYSSLFSNRYSSAKSAFSKALKVKPSDATAKAAYVQSLASDKSSSLSSLLSNAKRFEAQEEWGKALSNYQVVLQRDPNQVSAKLGQIKARARNQLDERLEKVLSDPLSLSKSNKKEQAVAVLNDARAISRKGTRIKQQISQIENAIEKLDSVISVTFLSDSLTDISLTKVGARKIKLGTFSSKNLALKPGRYVVSGSRLGFHDVRKEIEIQPGQSTIESINVRCDRPINGSA